MGNFGEDINSFLGRKLPNTSGPANVVTMAIVIILNYIIPVTIWTIVVTSLSRIFIVWEHWITVCLYVQYCVIFSWRKAWSTSLSTWEILRKILMQFYKFSALLYIFSLSVSHPIPCISVSLISSVVASYRVVLCRVYPKSGQTNNLQQLASWFQLPTNSLKSAYQTNELSLNHR